MQKLCAATCQASVGSATHEFECASARGPASFAALPCNHGRTGVFVPSVRAYTSPVEIRADLVSHQREPWRRPNCISSISTSVHRKIVQSMPSRPFEVGLVFEIDRDASCRRSIPRKNQAVYNGSRTRKVGCRIPKKARVLRRVLSSLQRLPPKISQAALLRSMLLENVR